MISTILIVDDQQKKIDALNDFFHLRQDDVTTSIAANFRAAQNILLHTSFDLILLDMSFDVHSSVSEDPTFAGLAGLHVLQFMRRAHIATPVIIVTSHQKFSDPTFGLIDGISALESHVRANFVEQVRGVIHLDVDRAEWHRKLAEALENVSPK